MATKSFLKNVNIKTASQAKKLIEALEKAEQIRDNRSASAKKFNAKPANRENLTGLINAAIDRLGDYFNPKTTSYHLRKQHNPETGADTLILEIHAQQDGDSAMQAFRRFEDDWWLDNLTDGDSLIIDVMFR